MKFKLNNDGLIPAIIQDYKSREILMLGYMNEKSFQITLDTKKVTFLADHKINYGLKERLQEISLTMYHMILIAIMTPF